MRTLTAYGIGVVIVLVVLTLFKTRQRHALLVQTCGHEVIGLNTYRSQKREEQLSAFPDVAVRVQAPCSGSSRPVRPWRRSYPASHVSTNRLRLAQSLLSLS